MHNIPTHELMYKENHTNVWGCAKMFVMHMSFLIAIRFFYTSLVGDFLSLSI